MIHSPYNIKRIGNLRKEMRSARMQD
jgi:hypothetical protein